MPAWNDLTDDQKHTIVESVMEEWPASRAQIAIEVYNATRKALGY